MISLTCVGAVDDNQTDVVATEETISEEISIDENIEIGNFSSLQGEIDKSQETKYLELDKDYAYNETTDTNPGIIIYTDNFVMDGKGHTLNGNGKARIVTSYASNITFKNIKFINANGAAIEFKANANCYNCTFMNNTGYMGGAIESSNQITLDNCKFFNNTATRQGGAVFSAGGTLTNSEFSDNQAALYGGAVYSDNFMSVDNCTFTNNIASENTASGGALCINGRVVNSRFTKNYAYLIGGAIYGTVNVINSEFIQNDGGDMGGAVFMYAEESIINSKFINNTAWNGAAIYINTNGTIENCEFEDNKAERRGGSVFVNYDGNIVNSQFANNFALWDGGAIYFDGNGNIDGSTFIDNTANRDGTALYCRNNITISDTTFKDKNTIAESVIICARGTLTENNVFLLFSTPGTFSSLSDEISACGDNILTLVNDYIYTPDVDDAGGYNDGIKITRDNFTIDGNGATIDGKGLARAFNITGNNVTLKNIKFVNGNASYGGAIYWESCNNSQIENCIFTNNSADDGGAIYFEDGELTVLNSKFISNSANQTGGALIFEGNELSISESEFVNNAANHYGAIYVHADKADISKSRFESNKAESGIATISADNSFIDECEFINNSAELYVGVSNIDGTMTINNSYFANNTANKSTRVIRNSQNSTAIITNCVFENNVGNEGNYSIDNNYGTIWLYNNTINNQSSEIYNYGRNITSPCTAIALENKTVPVALGEKTTLTAIITDDNGNLIQEAFYVYFKINDESIESTYNPQTSKYELEYTFNTAGTVTIGIACPSINITVKQGTCDVKHCTFADLANELNNCQNNTFELTKDYIYDSVNDSSYVDGIVIDRADFTVDGQGHTIDGAGLARIFTIAANNVTLKNIKFINGNASYGGAIYWESCSNSKIANCIFTNNSAVYGGANYFEGAINDLVISGDFINNTASKSGGANCFVDTVVKALISGNFEGNVAESGSGGANCFLDQVTNVTINGDYSCNMANSNCNGSDKSGSGGANCFSQEANDVFISGDYTGNVGYRGGANFFYKEASNVDMVGNYENNTALLFGGANYFMNQITNVSISGNYIANKATNRGGANYFNKFLSSVAISGEYINNSAAEGSALYFNRKMEDVSLFANFIDQENSTIFMGFRSDSTLTVDNIVFNYNDAGSSEISFTGATGVEAIVIDHPEAVVNATNDTITVSGLDVGIYTLAVTTIPDDEHDAVTKNVAVIVNKLETEVSASAVTATYNVNKDLVITLKDINGNPVTGVNVTVKLNGNKVYTADENGQIKASTKGLAPGTYIAEITFNGTANYAKATKSVKVTVKKATPKMTAKAKTFKVKDKTKKYTITLKDNVNKAIKSVKVTLNVNGKTYSAKTNSKGVATFKLTKLAKKGKFTAVVKFAGNKYYNAKTVKPKIVVK